MKNWRQTYSHKLVTATEALQSVRSGNRVVLGHACSEPSYLVEALLARQSELSAVELDHMVVIAAPDRIKPDMEAAFRFKGFFLGPATRDNVAAGIADFAPCFFSEVPRLFRERILPADVALIQVTPPDEEGYCSLGLSSDYTLAAAECATTVIAQMNPRMPRTFGTRLHLDQLTWIVEQETEIAEVFAPKFGDLEFTIGGHIASLVPDGATLQLGIGAIPEAALLCLKEKKDLGIHSEMFSDGVVTLAEAGVITNARKTLNPGKFVTTFLMGTRKLYDWVDNNPSVEVLPVNYVNDPCIIGQHDNMISINSALQVDLMGQVNAEMIGSRQFSGIGGQLDFVRGASRSKGGKSIIALPSTAARGTISRICRRLDEGAAVSTTRNDVHIIVTEYGVADLRGKTLQQRAEALIAIAHPEFREQLRGEARAMAASRA